jgi:hypothetical protein
MRFFTACLLITLLAAPVHAWNETGHMTVAYIAYQKLTPQTRGRVDTLLQRNPKYKTWIQNVPSEQRGLVAFLRASVWPDDIRSDPEYEQLDGTNNGNTPPNDKTASQNIGYKDHARHKYWHFINLPFPTLGQRGNNPPAVNAASQIVILRNALRNTSTSNAVEDIKSYDVTWLAHMVGDIHQPLHATARFTKLHPRGDTGGNVVIFCKSPCQQPENLHSYWDGLLGMDASLASIKQFGDLLLKQAPPTAAAIADIMTWAQESLALAKQHVYRPPISTGSDTAQPFSPRPDTAYESNAQGVAQRQVLMAGHRLANLLNSNLR